MVEILERRVLLSTAATSTNLHDIQNGPLAKAGGNLANLYLNYRSAQRAGTLTTFEKKTDAASNVVGGSPVDVVGNTVGVTLVANGSLSALEQQVEALGMSVQSITPADNAIAGFVPITLLSQVTQSSDVLHVTPLEKPILEQEGVGPNQADQALQAVEARSKYGLTGAGVTVGVISDSVSQVGGGLNDSIATGDLPKNVKVIQDGAPGSTDEGRAILEQIHDLAPDANLVFDTFGTTQQTFANAVAALQAAGCNVIIDDIGIPDEPFFQPGVIDQAIDNAVSDGVTYVTAAGNDANSGFEQAANFVTVAGRGGPFGGGGGGEFINFNPNGTAETQMTITITQEGLFTLEWDDAYDGVTGTVNADLNIFLYAAGTGNGQNGGVLEFAGVDDAFATGVPVQEFEVLPGTYQVEIEAVDTPTADLPTHYEFTNDTDAGSSISYTQYAGLRTYLIGHSAFSNAISTGAVDYSSAPPYSTVKPIPSELFSAQGPAIETRNAAGTLLPTAQTIDGPEVSATDGNNTSFFGFNGPEDPNKYPQFFGTSSAAGNLAGVVALLKQADSSATPAQILAALEATAIPVNGQKAGTYNDVSGHGLVDTVAAVAKLESEEAGAGGGASALVPVATISPVYPSPRATPVDSIDIDFNEVVTGFDISDLTLALAGGANLLTGSQTLTSSDGKNYVLGNLSSVTTAYGDYELSLSAAAAISSSTGVGLQSGATSFFEVEKDPGVPVQPVVTSISASSNSVALNIEQPGGGDAGFILERATDSSFTGKLTTKYISGTAETYVDTNVAPGTVYYYRVQSYNGEGSSIFSHATTVITLGAGEVILNNDSPKGVTVNGAWTTSTAVAGYEGTDYLQDDNSGKGAKTVIYRPTLSAAGEYDIYASWTTGSDRATNVPFNVFSSNGVLLQTVLVNEQTTGGNGWVLLGEYFLHSSTASFVRIGNAGTNGEVIANGVKFLPAGEIERQDGAFAATTSTTAKAASVIRAQALPTPSSTDELKALHQEVDT